MSIQPVNQCAIHFSIKDLSPTSLLLQLPLDIHRLIMHKVCDEKSALKSAIRAVEFGRVCVQTHELTHYDTDIDHLIQNKTKFDPHTEHLVSRFTNYMNNPPDAEDLSIMRAALDEDSYEDLRTKFLGVFEDYKLDHPGEDSSEALNDFRAQLKIYLDRQDHHNLRDLFNVFHALFKITVETIRRKPYGDSLEDVSTIAGYAAKAVNVLSDYPDLAHDFSKQIYQDIVQHFAKTPLKYITVEKYNTLIEQLTQYYQAIPRQTHECLLRQAIQEHHKPSEFAALEQEYANPSQGTLSPVKEQLKHEHLAKLDKINVEIKLLCGNNCNGLIDQAYRAMLADEHTATNFKEMYLEELKRQSALVTTFGANCSITVDGQIRLEATYSAYLGAHERSQTARKKFEELKGRLAELAVWTNGQITSGQKVEVEASLQYDQLTAEAYKQCSILSKFYAQLSNPVAIDNKANTNSSNN